MNSIPSTNRDAADLAIQRHFKVTKGGSGDARYLINRPTGVVHIELEGADVAHIPLGETTVTRISEKFQVSGAKRHVLVLFNHNKVRRAVLAHNCQAVRNKTAQVFSKTAGVLVEVFFNTELSSI